MTARPRVRPLKAAIRLALSAGMLAIVFAIVDTDEILAAFESVRLGPWSFGLAAFLVLHVVSAAKWRWFIVVAGAQPSFFDAVRCYGAGLFANLCLPSLVGGDLVRAALLMQKVEHKEAIALGSVVDRMSDVLALGLLVAAGLVVAPTALEGSGALEGFIAFAVVFGAGVIGLLVLRFVLTRLPPEKLPGKVRSIVQRLLEAAGALSGRWPRAAVGLAMSLTLQAGFVLVNVHLGDMMGLELDLRLWFLLWPLAKIAAMVPVSLGGLGVREAAFATLVKPFAAPALAIAESLVWQSILFAGGIVAGAWWLVTGRRP